MRVRIMLSKICAGFTDQKFGLECAGSYRQISHIEYLYMALLTEVSRVCVSRGGLLPET